MDTRRKQRSNLCGYLGEVFQANKTSEGKNLLGSLRNSGEANGFRVAYSRERVLRNEIRMVLHWGSSGWTIVKTLFFKIVRWEALRVFGAEESYKDLYFNRFILTAMLILDYKRARQEV